MTTPRPERPVAAALEKLRGETDSIGRFEREPGGDLLLFEEVLAVLGLAHRWPPAADGDRGICADCGEFWPCHYAEVGGTALATARKETT